MILIYNVYYSGGSSQQSTSTILDFLVLHFKRLLVDRANDEFNINKSWNATISNLIWN